MKCTRNSTSLNERVRAIDALIKTMPCPNVSWAVAQIGGISRASYYRLKAEAPTAMEAVEAAPLSEDSPGAGTPSVPRGEKSA